MYEFHEFFSILCSAAPICNHLGKICLITASDQQAFPRIFIHSLPCQSIVYHTCFRLTMKTFPYIFQIRIYLLLQRSFNFRNFLYLYCKNFIFSSRKTVMYTSPVPMPSCCQENSPRSCPDAISKSKCCRCLLKNFCQRIRQAAAWAGSIRITSTTAPFPMPWSCRVQKTSANIWKEFTIPSS